MEHLETISILEYLKGKEVLEIETDYMLQNQSHDENYKEKRWGFILQYFREVRSKKFNAHGDSILFEMAFLGDKDSPVTKHAILNLKKKGLLEESFER